MISIVGLVFEQGDAPERLALAPEKEELGLGMLVKGMLLRIQLSSCVGPDGRDPEGVTCVKLIREIHETLDFPLRSEVDLFYLQMIFSACTLPEIVTLPARAYNQRTSQLWETGK